MVVDGVITYSEWLPTGKIAIVHKQTKYGEFRAMALSAEEDLEIATEWDGYKFAEYQCDIQYMNERAKRFYERYLGARAAYNNLCQDNDKNDPILLKLERQVKLAKRDAAIARDECESMREYYNYYCDHIIDERKKLHEWKLKRQEALTAEND